MIETILSILAVAKDATSLYDWFGGVSMGGRLAQTLKELEKTKVEVKRLSDHVLYAPAIRQVTNCEGASEIADLRRGAELLVPLAKAFDSDVLGSAIATTPERLRTAFQKDPWEVLVDIRPAQRAKRPSNPDLMPITFSDGEQMYIGWQTRGALPLLFNCEFADPVDHPFGLSLPQDRSPTSVWTAEQELALRTEQVDGSVTVPAPHHLPKSPSVTVRDHVVQILRNGVSNGRFFIWPDVPRQKAEMAINAGGLASNIDILGLLDQTYADSGMEFCIFSLHELHVRQFRKNYTFGYNELKRAKVSKSPSALSVKVAGTRFLVGVTGRAQDQFIRLFGALGEWAGH